MEPHRALQRTAILHENRTRAACYKNALPQGTAILARVFVLWGGLKLTEAFQTGCWHWHVLCGACHSLC